MFPVGVHKVRKDMCVKQSCTIFILCNFERIWEQCTPHFLSIPVKRSWGSNPGCLYAFFINVSSPNIKTQDIPFDIETLASGFCTTHLKKTQGVASVMLNYNIVERCCFETRVGKIHFHFILNCTALCCSILTDRKTFNIPISVTATGVWSVFAVHFAVLCRTPTISYSLSTALACCCWTLKFLFVRSQLSAVWQTQFSSHEGFVSLYALSLKSYSCLITVLMSVSLH